MATRSCFMIFAFCILGLTTSAMAKEGGVTGGGGGTTNPNPVGSDYIRQFILQDARVVLTAYLQQQQYWWETVEKGRIDADPEDKFLFDRQDDALSYLQKAVVEVHGSTPCHDSGGNASDGSIYANQSGAICISSFNLGAKLNWSNAQYETAALILHEIVHQMGGDEQQAVAIQTSAGYKLAKESSTDLHVSYSLLANDLKAALVNLSLLQSLSKVKGNSYQFQSSFQNLQSLLDRFAANWDTHPFALQTRLNFEDAVSKLLILQSYAISIDPAVDTGVQQMEQAQYLKGFAGQTSLSLSDYLFNRDGVRPPEGGSMMITKIENDNALKAELQTVVDAVVQARNSIGTLLNLRIGFIDSK